MELYTRFDVASGLTVFEKAPLTKVVIRTWCRGNSVQKKMHSRDVIEDREKTLMETVHNSVGLDGELGIKSELYILLEEY